MLTDFAIYFSIQTLNLCSRYLKLCHSIMVLSLVWFIIKIK